MKSGKEGNYAKIGVKNNSERREKKKTENVENN